MTRGAWGSVSAAFAVLGACAGRSVAGAPSSPSAPIEPAAMDAASIAAQDDASTAEAGSATPPDAGPDAEGPPPAMTLFEHDSRFFVIASIAGERLCLKAETTVRPGGGLVYLRAPVHDARTDLYYRVVGPHSLVFRVMRTPYPHQPPGGSRAFSTRCEANVELAGTTEDATMEGAPLYRRQEECEANRLTSNPLPLRDPRKDAAHGAFWCFRLLDEILEKRFWKDGGP